MLYLRSLSEAMLAEYRQSGDVSRTEPGERVVPCFFVCRQDSGSECLCRRCFIGLESRQFTSLAVICSGDSTELLMEYVESPTFKMMVSKCASEFPSREELMEELIRNHLRGVDAGLRHYPEGLIVRTLNAPPVVQVYPWYEEVSETPAHAGGQETEFAE